ncbi:M24 family metallopeptidase [Bacteroidota bacterium]
MLLKNLNWDFIIRSSIILIFVFLLSCSEKEIKQPFLSENNPWQSIRKERIYKLLPHAMKNGGVDAWIVICRENNNDPLAMHIGGENAGGTAAFMFFLTGEKVRSLVISPKGEATALKEMELHDEVFVIERGSNIWGMVAQQIKENDPMKIAINSSAYNIADGLSFTQRTLLNEALDPEYVERILPSTDLVMEWLSVKLPEEVEIMRKAAEITAQLQVEAYKTIVPGETKDSDVAAYIKKRMKELGVTDAWAPDQNPNVNSGQDRGHSHATDKIIQPGDVIQTDFGIKVYDTWCSDIQRFAYVLKQDESEPPEEMKKYFDNAIKGHRKVLTAMKPGVTGWEVDKTQRDWIKESGSLPIMWGTGHPVGYWAHDAGPALSGAAHWHIPFRNNARLLRKGQTFAYDGFFKWEREDGTTKTISVEEMAVVTDSGAEYLIKPQEEWILISSK